LPCLQDPTAVPTPCQINPLQTLRPSLFKSHVSITHSFILNPPLVFFVPMFYIVWAFLISPMRAACPDYPIYLLVIILLEFGVDRTIAQAVSHLLPGAVVRFSILGHVRFVLQVAVGRDLFEYFGFLCQFSLHFLLHSD
jgi:hypothetical protein